ncbi:MAG TPA: hypothetical protein VMZ66_09630 [Aeromicrobium sp.]|nr:hypothetical protein [Aeromicrobium sp.]
MEIWSAVIGGVVGALIGVGGTFVVTRWQTNRVIQHAASQSAAAAAEQAHTAQWHTGIAAANQMLAPLENLRVRIDDLDGRIPGTQSRLGDAATTGQRVDAHAAHDELRHLVQSHGVLLPDELSTRWYFLTQLLDEYVEAQRQRGEFWTGQRLRRCRDDLVNYIGYVRESLAVYIKTGDETKHCEPPLLEREDLEPWTPG